MNDKVVFFNQSRVGYFTASTNQRIFVVVPPPALIMKREFSCCSRSGGPLSFLGQRGSLSFSRSRGVRRRRRLFFFFPFCVLTTAAPVLPPPRLRRRLCDSSSNNSSGGATAIPFSRHLRYFCSIGERRFVFPFAFPPVPAAAIGAEARNGEGGRESSGNPV